MQSELVVAQPAHHVKVEIGNHVGESQQGVLGKPGRSEQPEFLAGPEGNQDAAPEFLRLPGRFVGQ